MKKIIENENRRNTICIRLTDNELARLRFICEKLNLFQSEVIREAILTAKVTRTTGVTVMDRGTAKELYAHFG